MKGRTKRSPKNHTDALDNFLGKAASAKEVAYIHIAGTLAESMRLQNIATAELGEMLNRQNGGSKV